jgi:translation elongation factor EF-1alpha
MNLLLQSFGLNDNAFIPISSIFCDNLINKSEKMEWFKWETIIQAIDSIEAPKEILKRVFECVFLIALMIKDPFLLLEKLNQVMFVKQIE